MQRCVWGSNASPSAETHISLKKYGGGGGIRTPGTVKPNGFQDRRIRPLCHLPGALRLAMPVIQVNPP